MNLNQVTLPVREMKAATEFYQDLGFRLIVDSPHYARFECPEGSSSFSLSLNEGRFTNGAIIYFEHEELDQWVGLLKAKGVKFDSEPTDKTYLWREAELRDPSDNRIILFRAGENRLNPPWRKR